MPSLNTTIAFDNSDLFWKTRYSFFSSCYAWLNKLLISFHKTEAPANQGVLFYSHNAGVGYNNFYANTAVIGSSIHVSFNNQVSNNKIFKTLSIEGTQNIKDNIGVFSVNSDNSPDKNFAVGKLKDKGGIVYMDIGRNNKNTSANVKCMGVISSADVIDVDHSLYDTISDLNAIGRYMSFSLFGGDSSSQSGGAGGQRSVYFIKKVSTSSPSSEPELVFNLDYEPIIHSSTHAAMRDSTLGINSVDYFRLPLIDSPDADVPNHYNGEKILFARNLPAVGVDSDAQSMSDTINNDDSNTYFLFQVSANSIYGDEPRGQYAEAYIVLGNLPFEVYAMNLNYEPTNLDHSE